MSLFPQNMMVKPLSLETIAARLTYFQEQIKLLHWRTKIYAEHKTLDKLYGQVSDIRDQIVEEMMGYTKRTIGAFKIDPITENITAPILMDQLISFAKSLDEFGDSNNMPDICNIAQSLSGNAARAQYLLTQS